MTFLIFAAFIFSCFTFAQIQNCYRKDGQQMPDFPCNPESNVSACCGRSWQCSTNLYCTDENGWKGMGSCTDVTWQSSACPFPELNSGPNEFNYNANTTNCGDGTVCPNPGNQTCCSDHQGIRVIHFNNTDHLPEDPEGLAAYYSDGGYTISPSASASPTFVSFASRSPLTFPSSSPITFESSFPSSSETFAAQSSKNSPSAKSASSRPGPSDLPSLPKQSSPLSQPASTSYPALPLPTANSTQSATRSTLGSGAAAGIGVGVTVAALAIGMLLGLLLRSYQRRRKLHQAASPYAMPTDGGRRFEKPEMSADAARVEMDAGLLSRRQIHEINTES